MKKIGISYQGFLRLAQATGKECPYRKMLREDFNIDMDEYSDQVPGGKGDKARPPDFPLDQVRKGVEVELEHTDDPYMALEIALDHLTEFEDYYSGLDEMEKSLKKE